jgi:DNA-binding NtrC family response regulator
LRERPEDIPLTVAHFLKRKVHPRSGQPFQMTRATMAALCGYSWPGNVRELENVVERAATLCDGEVIQTTDLPPTVRQPAVADGAETGLSEAATPDALYPLQIGAEKPRSTGSTGTLASLEPLKDFLREQEVAYLNRALAQTGGDKEKAAALLGVSLATLYRKLAGEGNG